MDPRHRLAARESHVERQIREAMEAGSFDDLPYQGRPLPLEDDVAAGDRSMAHRMLRDAGFAPPWIEADKEVRVLLNARDRVIAAARRRTSPPDRRMREELERLVDEVNRAIERLNAEAPTDRQHRRPLDRGSELRALEDAFAGG